MKRRFEYMLDPLDQFVIYDRQADAPVTVGGRILTASSLEEACKLTASLNARDYGTRAKKWPAPLLRVVGGRDCVEALGQDSRSSPAARRGTS